MKADLCLVLVEDLSRLYFTVFDIVSLTFVLWSRSYLYNVCFIIWHLIVANHIQISCCSNLMTRTPWTMMQQLFSAMTRKSLRKMFRGRWLEATLVKPTSLGVYKAWRWWPVSDTWETVSDHSSVCYVKHKMARKKTLDWRLKYPGNVI